MFISSLLHILYRLTRFLDLSAKKVVVKTLHYCVFNCFITYQRHLFFSFKFCNQIFLSPKLFHGEHQYRQKHSSRQNEKSHQNVFVGNGFQNIFLFTQKCRLFVQLKFRHAISLFSNYSKIPIVFSGLGTLFFYFGVNPA